MSDATGEVEVTTAVEVPTEETPETIVESSPTVIVESAPAEGTVTEAELERAVETAVEQTAIEIALAGALDQLADHGARLDRLEAGEQYTAQAVAEVAQTQDEMGAALTEEVQESLGEGPDTDGDGRPDDPPQTARKHWLFRPMSEWRS
jgi:hypothetical protein